MIQSKIVDEWMKHHKKHEINDLCTTHSEIDSSENKAKYRYLYPYDET